MLQIAKMAWIGLVGYLKRTADLDNFAVINGEIYYPIRIRNLKHKLGMYSEI